MWNVLIITYLPVISYLFSLSLSKLLNESTIEKIVLIDVQGPKVSPNITFVVSQKKFVRVAVENQFVQQNERTNERTTSIRQIQFLRSSPVQSSPAPFPVQSRPCPSESERLINMSKRYWQQGRSAGLAEKTFYAKKK